MTTFQPYKNSVSSIAKAVNAGLMDPGELAAFYLHRIGQANAEVNAVVASNEEIVARQVTVLKQRLNDREDLPLAGVPVLVKDNICSTEYPTTCASQLLKSYISPYDATVVTALRQAGALILGKTNLDEFAMGSSNENSSLGKVANPWQKDRVPGGSSGGSAAAVAADFSPLALGSDTGGSIRQPASFCGVVGLKPTYGSVSRYGLVAFGSSLDQVGPLTRSVEDCALAASVLIGHDAADATSMKSPYDPSELRSLVPQIPKKIGFVREFMGEGIDAPVRESVEAALDVWRQAGAEIAEVSIPEVEHSIAAYYLIATAEASANLARFDGVRYGDRVAEPGTSLRDMYCNTRSQGFGREVKQRIMLGTFALSAGYYDAYYSKATAVRGAIRKGFASAFDKVDLLVSPTAPSVAFRQGEKANDPLSMYLSDLCTIGANLAGIPALSLPCGFDQGLPIGLQLMAPWFHEKQLLETAHGFEQTTDWQRHPDF